MDKSLEANLKALEEKKTELISKLATVETRMEEHIYNTLYKDNPEFKRLSENNDKVKNYIKNKACELSSLVIEQISEKIKRYEKGIEHLRLEDYSN